MPSPLHLISGREQFLQLAKPETPSSVPFFETLTGKPIVHQETLDLAVKVHPVLFRKKSTRERASALLLTKFERATFLPPTSRFFRERPQLIAHVIEVMDSRFGTVQAILDSREVNDFFANLVRTILESTVRRRNGWEPLSKSLLSTRNEEK